MLCKRYKGFPGNVKKGKRQTGVTIHDGLKNGVDFTTGGTPVALFGRLRKYTERGGGVVKGKKKEP